MKVSAEKKADEVSSGTCSERDILLDNIQLSALGTDIAVV